MNASFRFLRCKDGKTYFARVGLDVCPNGNGITVEDALPPKADADAGEVNANTAPTWVAAARDGIRTAVEHARDRGLVPGGCHVRLTELVGTLVDTREDVIRCAAALAAWQAIGAPEPGPDTAFNGVAWTLLFPASVGHPATGTAP
jgi:hypothetical protein